MKYPVSEPGQLNKAANELIVTVFLMRASCAGNKRFWKMACRFDERRLFNLLNL